MNMREQIAVLTQQVEDLKAKIVQQNVDFSIKADDHIEDLARIAAEHKKVIESKDSSIRYAQEGRERLQAELNALQDVLDVIPGVIPREKEGQYGNTTNSSVVRLASVLASKFQ